MFDERGLACTHLTLERKHAVRFSSLQYIQGTHLLSLLIKQQKSAIFAFFDCIRVHVYAFYANLSALFWLENTRKVLCLF